MIRKRLNDKKLSHVISLAKTLCNTQFVYLHLIDELDECEVLPSYQTIEHERGLEINNLRSEERYKHSSFLQQHPNLNYYFGIHLKTSDNKTIASICVYKEHEERLTQSQQASLSNLAELASDLIEGKLSSSSYIEQISVRDKKLVQLFEQAKDPLMTLEPPNWCFTSGNPAALKLFKVESEQHFTQLGPWILSPQYQPDGTLSKEKAKAVVQEALKKGSCSFEWLHQSLDGEEIPCNVFLNRIIEGNKRYLHATVKDISERKSLESNLTNQLAINRGILNSTSEGILLVDHDSRKIQSYNDQFLSMLKIPQALVDTNDDGKIVSHILKQLDNSATFIDTVEYLYQNPHQESQDTLIFKDDRVIERYSTPFICAGIIKGRIWFYRDVTEIRAMEKLVNQSSRLAAIGQLAAGIGHEINNPLTIIEGHISKMTRQNKSISADILESLDIINKASERIKNITSGLRSFAHIEKNTAIERFNLYSLLFEIENMLKGIYSNDRICLEFDYSQLNKAATIEGERGKFEQILINLISNAKDSTEDMTLRVINLVIKSEIQNGCGHIIVSILDNGVGVPKEIKDKIFDPFFTTKEVGKGTGIGLSLVYRFVTDEFNGRISLSKSGLGDGSRFDISVPAYCESPVDLDEPLQDQTQKLTIRNETLCVILVDDELTIRELLRDILEVAGFSVICCENGVEALHKYLEDPDAIDLIISDVKMPHMDGPTLLSEVRGKTSLKQPKFFFITGGIDIDFANTCDIWIDTIDGYFYKPFSFSDVLEKIKKSFKK
ncbi:MAG: ATP-binding protein [Thalassotalea sp.]|nr:ATP-binding protein [Thalassotalea sp.]